MNRSELTRIANLEKAKKAQPELTDMEKSADHEASLPVKAKPKKKAKAK